MKLLHDLLDLSPGQRGGALAVRGSGVDLSYPELAERSLRIANALCELGIRKHDRIAVCLPNHPATIEIAMACSRLGAIFVPVNPVLKTRQVVHILTDCSARVLVATESALGQYRDGLTSVPSLEISISLGATPAAKRVVALAELRDAPARAISRCAIEQDVAAILYTSGSTGRPKGVVISHRNFVTGAMCVAEYLENRPDDRILAALPLSFDYGFSQVTTSLCVGACAVLTQFALPNALVQEAAAEEITGLAGVPTMWAHLAQVDWPSQCRARLRYITNSGGPLPSAIIRALRDKLEMTRIFAMYGLTEAFRSTYLAPGELATRPGSIGKAIPQQEILVLRADGTPCEPGEPGELVHRGSLVTLGYWNDAALTAARFRPLPPRVAGAPTQEIAVWSGDLVRRDEDDFLFFIGRMDEQIKTSGYRVNPLEIEEVIAEVEGVLASIAVGIPDETLGQRIGLVVCPRSEDRGIVERVRRHCRRELPTYMVPSEIRLVSEIPMTANGKIDREAALRALLAAG